MLPALRTFPLSAAIARPCRRILAPAVVNAPQRRTAAKVAGPKKARRIQEYMYEEMTATDERDREFEDFKFDDISSIGHGQLEQHREIRQYARVAAYEMPRLFDLAKPFEPPTEATPLRFRYTTYMGEEHPAQAKVVVEFSPADLPLTEQQQHKLIKLVRMRYNPDKQSVKMSCEKFPHPAQNKRYLLDKIDELIAEAKDTTDTFEDIPFDFRHHKPKKMPLAFPEEWIEIAKQKEQERLARMHMPPVDVVNS